jgi:Rod binding domain-containing protein
MTSIVSSSIQTVIDPAMLHTSGPAGKPDPKATAKTNAQNFEATFLNLMFQHMFTDTDGDGPLGGGTGVGVWRSFLTDEFSKSFAKQGGVGIADQVYQSLISHQEAAQAN